MGHVARRFWRDHPGARHGELVLGRRVGTGGTATVYEAHLRGRVVICKVLSQRHGAELELARRLRDEGRYLAALGPGPWPSIFERGELPDGRPYLVMERLNGRSLRDQVRRFGAVPPARVRRWMEAVLAALATLHDRGLVHCDLKPDNIFLCHDGRLELLDLGAVESVGRPLASAIGTPPYMAPEQRAGGYVDARTDVFATGWLAAELLAGGHPGRTLPARWQPLLDRARALDPAARFADTRAFAAALQATGRGPASPPLCPASAPSCPRPVSADALPGLRAPPSSGLRALTPTSSSGMRSGLWRVPSAVSCLRAAAASPLEPVEVLGDLEAVDLTEPDETNRLEVAARPDRARSGGDRDAVELDLQRLHQGWLASPRSPEERAVDAQLDRPRLQVRHGQVRAQPHAGAPVHHRVTHHKGESTTYM